MFGKEKFSPDLHKVFVSVHADFAPADTNTDTTRLLVRYTISSRPVWLVRLLYELQYRKSLILCGLAHATPIERARPAQNLPKMQDFCPNSAKILPVISFFALHTEQIILFSVAFCKNFAFFEKFSCMEF